MLHLSLTVSVTFSAEPPGGAEAELPEALLPHHQRTAEGEEGRAEGGAAEPREEGISGMCLEGRNHAQMLPWAARHSGIEYHSSDIDIFLAGETLQL